MAKLSYKVYKIEVVGNADKKILVATFLRIIDARVFCQTPHGVAEKYVMEMP